MVMKKFCCIVLFLIIISSCGKQKDISGYYMVTSFQRGGTEKQNAELSNWAMNLVLKNDGSYLCREVDKLIEKEWSGDFKLDDNKILFTNFEGRFTVFNYDLNNKYLSLKLDSVDIGAINRQRNLKMPEFNMTLLRYAKNDTTAANILTKRLFDSKLIKSVHEKTIITSITNESLELIILKHKLSDPINAPDFTLFDLKGNPISLKDYRSKVVVLDFWATWCGPCKEELPHFQELMNSYQNNSSVVFLTISEDKNKDVVEKFIVENNYTFPVLMDKEVGVQYDVKGIPATFVIDKNGYIQYKHSGYLVNVDFKQMLSLEIQTILGKDG